MTRTRASRRGPISACLSLLAVPALAMLPGSVSAQTASDPAVTYQINPAHDGHQANDTLTPPLAQRWSATFSGHVSYALIANGQVFVMVGHPNVFVTSSTYTFGASLHAFSQSTGSELWSYDMPATGIYADNFGAAAYDNGQVFAVNSDGTMNAFDASTGHLNWTQKGLGTGIPVALNGVVYEGSVTGGAQGGQAVSEADGHVLWSYNNLSTSGQHPSVTSSGVYLTDWCQNNYNLASPDGHVVWTTTPTGCTTGGYNVSPVYSGRLYSRSPAGPNNIYDASSGALLGTYRSDRNEAFDGSIAFLSYGTQLSATDLTTGRVLWRFNGDCDLLSSPVVANGYIYIGSTQGHIYALNEQTGSPVWSDSIGSPIGLRQDWSPDGPPFGLAVGEGLLAVVATDKLVVYAPGTTSTHAPPILDTEAVSHYWTTGQVFWITKGPDDNLWATEFYDNRIARTTTSGAVTEFTIPTTSSNPVHIVSGPDGALWFTELGGKVGRITTSGTFTEYPLSPYTQPYGITVGPDNNLWVTEAGFGQIVQMHTDGSLGTTVTLPGATPADSRSPHGITTGPDGNLWVTESAPGRAIIARITPDGSVTEFLLSKTIETDYAQPEDIVSGPDGNLWFTIPGDAGYPSGRTPVTHAELGRITTTGSISYFTVPTPFSSPYGLTVGPDGALWFTEAQHLDNTPAKIGRMTTSGVASEYWDSGGYPKPRGITVGPDGNLWFGDGPRAAGRVVPSLGGCPVSSGQLRVTTSPPVPSQILVDGTTMDSWGLNWVDLSPGSHTISYRHVQGFTEPAPQTVDVSPRAITTTTGNFVQRGSLHVTTSPAVPAPIYVDGTVRDDWGLWTDLQTGPHQVCFGPVADYKPPPCQSVTLTVGATTNVTGSYTSSPGQPGPTGTVRLRVTTNPPLPSQILVNGVPMDSWSLNWVDVAAGNTYTISWTHVEGYTEPAPYTVSLYSVGATVDGNFTQNGWLRVITSPAEPAAISVDGLVRDDWGIWTDLPVGDHIVCFGPVAGTVAPPCQSVRLGAGALSTVTGTYTPGARIARATQEGLSVTGQRRRATSCQSHQSRSPTSH